MAFFFTNLDDTENAAGTPVYSLGNGDRLTVGPDAVLAAVGTNASAVVGGNFVTVQLAGDLVSLDEHGIEAGSGADISLSATGSITAWESGIRFLGASNQVTNAGSIDSGGIAVHFGTGGGTLLNSGMISGLFGVYAEDPLMLHNSGTIQARGAIAPGQPANPGAAIQLWGSGSSSITNSGLITSVQGPAIVLQTLDGYLTTVTNTGTIAAGPGFEAIQALASADSVTNAGTIIGDVWLGGGHDSYEGSAGLLLGRVFAEAGNDTVIGGGQGEVLDAGDGADSVEGNGGADHLRGGNGQDSLDGGDGNDVVDGGEGIDVMDGGAGFDILSYASSATGVYVSLATGDAWGGNAAGDVFRNFEGLRGSGAHDSLIGSNGDDVMFGFRGNDMLRGGGGNDRLLGEEGDDTLTGGNGLDVLRGGSGADLFRYHDIAESTVAARGRDRLMDFARLEGDRIDLQFIDADTTQAGDQAFSFIGAAAFGGIAGQLRYVALTDTTLVQADVDGDAAADFSVQIAGNLLMLGADFIL